MAVTLVDERERIKFEYKGSAFWLRRADTKEKGRIRKAHTTMIKGVEHTDFGAVADALLSFCVLGWENVVDIHGKQIPFSTDVLPRLPDDTKTAIMDYLDESEIVHDAKKEAELGE